MIVGYHVVFGAYGFWLPNDLRGSWSTFVGSLDLYYATGPATKTNDPRSLAHKAHDRKKRLAAKSALKHSVVRFTGLQARAVGRGFAEYFKASNNPVWACAILPDHVHLVIGRPRIVVERLVIQLKGAAVRQLIAENRHPFAEFPEKSGQLPKCFVRGQHMGFLDDDDVAPAIRYVEQNPVKQGLPRQKWDFVQRVL